MLVSVTVSTLDMDHTEAETILNAFSRGKQRATNFSHCFSNVRSDTADKWLKSVVPAGNYLI